MCGTSTKQKVLEALGRLPSDATFEDAIDRIVLLAKIERGLAELDAPPESGPRSGRVVPELNDQALHEVVRGNYRVVYRQQGGSVDIVTVVPSGHLFRLDWS